MEVAEDNYCQRKTQFVNERKLKTVAHCLFDPPEGRLAGSQGVPAIRPHPGCQGSCLTSALPPEKTAAQWLLSFPAQVLRSCIFSLEHIQSTLNALSPFFSLSLFFPLCLAARGIFFLLYSCSTPCPTSQSLSFSLSQILLLTWWIRRIVLKIVFLHQEVTL